MPDWDVLAAYEAIAEWFGTTRRGARGSMERPYLEALARVMPTGGTLLDLGCGVGQPIAAHFLRQGYAVTGVDGVRAMVDACRAAFPAGEWLLADMRRLDLGRAFHAVVAWDSFFHLTKDEQRAMFPVLGRHTAAGGGLLFTSGPDDGQAQGEMQGVRFEYSSLSPDEYTRLLAAEGFAVELHVVEDPQCGGHTVWLARKAG